MMRGGGGGGGGGCCFHQGRQLVNCLLLPLVFKPFEKVAHHTQKNLLGKNLLL